MNITPFNFESHPVRVVTDENGEPWFVAAEVCAILEISNASQSVSRLDDDEKGITTIDTLGGKQETLTINESGLYSLVLTSRKLEAKRFKRWITHDVLPTIRKTGGYTVKQQPPQAEAFKLIPVVVRAARSLGLDKNAAAISANQAVTKITGTNVLQLLGHTHLEAEQQVLFFTPTELGERMGVSGRKFNLLLAEAGMQAKEGEHWVPLPPAEGFYRVLDTSKRHNDGTMVQQVKWAEHVLALVQQAA